MSDERFYSEDTFEDKHSGNPEDAGQHDAGQDRTQEIQERVLHMSTAVIEDGAAEQRPV